MQKINRESLAHDFVTDVITFDLTVKKLSIKNKCLDGEIVICPDVALQQSKEYNNSFDKELMLYIVHGIAHLCGYDDQTVAQQKKIRREEARLLRLAYA